MVNLVQQKSRIVKKKWLFWQWKSAILIVWSKHQLFISHHLSKNFIVIVHFGISKFQNTNQEINLLFSLSIYATQHIIFHHKWEKKWHWPHLGLFKVRMRQLTWDIAVFLMFKTEILPWTILFSFFRWATDELCHKLIGLTKGMIFSILLRYINITWAQCNTKHP